MSIKFNEDYKLKDENHYNVICSKSQIVLCNSMSTDMNHMNRWLNRLEGTNKFTTPFTIDLNGVVYKHYDPMYWSSVIGNEKVDKHLIGITLVNEGYLNYEKNNLVTWIGDIYNRADDVVDKLWRDKKTWAPYTKKQLNSLYKLCEYLSIEFDITMAFVGHNTELSNPESYDGILCRSNFSKYYYDVSPAFDFKYFNNKFNKTDNQ